MSRSPKGTAPLLRFHISTSITYHHSGPHGESHHLREDLDLLDEVADELVVVCQGITLAGLQLFAKGYVTIKFSLSCNAFAPSCAKCTP